MSAKTTSPTFSTSTLVLTAIAVLGLAAAWWSYPEENHFSIMRCTISFLGSPDPNRNPTGWRFYQVGMTALSLILGQFVTKRHHRLKPMLGNRVVLSSSLIFVALALMFFAVWIPDSREALWLGLPKGHWHTRAAIIAIPFLLLGITIDGVSLRRRGANAWTLWPFRLYGILALAGAGFLAGWEIKCRRNPALPHWPGMGLHSTPLWEWILFVYLVGFLCWLAHARLALPSPNKPRG